jgi:hypothetical protein
MSSDTVCMQAGVFSFILLLGTIVNVQTQYIMDNRYPSGAAFIPIMQSRLAMNLAKIKVSELDTLNVGEVMSVLEDDIVKLNDAIDAIFLAIQTSCVVRLL